MHLSRKLRKYTALLSAIFLTLTLFTCTLADYMRVSARVRENVLRLHVIANSDSEADQAVKLLVRDTLLERGAAVFDGSVTAGDAEEKLIPALELLQNEAAAVLRENGFSYGAQAEISYEFFDTRVYGDLTLPAGYYKALKVVLGGGQGKNWWCVMFPPLCLPAAEKQEDGAIPVFSNEELDVLRPKGGYIVKFKLAELFERLSEKLRQKGKGA